MVRYALCLALLSATAPALAEGPAPRPSRVALASLVVQRSATELLAGQGSPTMAKPVRREFVGGMTLGLTQSATLLAVTPGVVSDMGPPTTKAKSQGGSDYKTLIGQLVIARDLQIPGSSTMAVRLIPARQALAGETSPIVFTPRVVGSSWYGLDVAARF